MILWFCTIPGVLETHLVCVSAYFCMWVRVLTVHVQPLHDDGELHLTGHVTQGAHGHAQLLLGDESIAVAVKHTECLTDLCTRTQQHILLSPPCCKTLLFPALRTTWHAQFSFSESVNVVNRFKENDLYRKCSHCNPVSKMYGISHLVMTESLDNGGLWNLAFSKRGLIGLDTPLPEITRKCLFVSLFGADLWNFLASLWQAHQVWY